MIHFNALAAFDSLKDAGLSEPQARAVVNTVSQASLMNSEEIATKKDILKVEGQINEFKIATKNDILKLEGQINELRSETKSDILKVEGQINELKISMHWLQRFFFGGMLLILVNIGINLLHLPY